MELGGSIKVDFYWCNQKKPLRRRDMKFNGIVADEAAEEERVCCKEAQR